MRIVVIGAYGLLGSYIVSRLLANGHDLVGVGRDIVRARRQFPRMAWVRADLRSATEAQWAGVLAQADAVVNCAGALQDSPRDDLQAVHVTGVERLAEACQAAGIRRFVQVSAAGVRAGRDTAFNDTKLAAETVLQASTLDWVILRPGLVLAPAAYGGTALLRGLAAFPFVLPVANADSIVQVVSAPDVAAAVERVLRDPGVNRVSIDLLHAETWRFRDLAVELRRWLGLEPAPVLAIPAWLVGAAAATADGLAYLGWRSPMRSTALAQLHMGIEGDAEAAPRLLGLTLRSLRQMLDDWPSGVQERWFAKAYFVKPALLVGLGTFWLLSGVIGLVSRAEAVSTLTVVGMPTPLAQLAVVAGALVDIALATSVAFRRSAGHALVGMLLVSAFYLVCGSVVRPDLWLDPLGPFLKVVPAALAAAAALALLDER